MDIEIIKNPVYKSRLIFLDENFVTIDYKEPVPNWWWRLWHYLLFGIKWRSL